MAKLGTSLIVPSVQELAKQPITQVPERYVRPNQDPPVVSNTTSSPPVPVKDLNKLLLEDATELEKLDQACKEWGFFRKMKLWQTPEDVKGFGQLFVLSEEQNLDWADMFFITTLPSNARNPRLFPSIPQPFRDNVETYSSELHNICITIIGLMTKTLKIKPNELLELFEDTKHVNGLNPHSDAGALTILLQVNETERLQIRKDGMWIPIQPLSNAFVINVGDTLEILTNGIYRSIEHRATVNSEKERISIATFHRPGLNRVMVPVPSLVTPEKPALFKRICVADYYSGFLARELQGKSYMDVIRIHNEK